MYFFSDKIKAYDLKYDGHDPGQWIGQKQKSQWSVVREKSEDPQNSAAYCPYYREDHRNSGVSHTAQGSRKKTHNTAQKIGEGSICQYFHTTLNYLGIPGINGKKLRAEDVSTAAQKQSDRGC